MLTLAYAIPVLACAVMYAGLGFGADWTSYAAVAGCGWTLAALCQWVCRSATVHRTEYVGAYLTGVYHEYAWTERVPATEVVTDEQGMRHAVERVDLYVHPDRYYVQTSRGTCMDVGLDFFCRVRDVWAQPRADDRWHDARIEGGVRRGCHYALPSGCLTEKGIADDRQASLFPVAEPVCYIDRARGMAAWLSYGHVSRKRAMERGLIDYPERDKAHDVPAVCSRDCDVPQDIDRAYRLFNAVVAARRHMRLYVLVYDARRHDTEVVVRQRAYWNGGGQNELVVCLGMDNGRVQWAQAFSQADATGLERAVESWMRHHVDNALQQFLPWLETQLGLWPGCAVMPSKQVPGLTSAEGLLVNAAAFIGAVGQLSVLLR